MPATKRLLFVSALSLFLASCGNGNNAASLTSPTPVSPAGPAAPTTVALSGTVSEVTPAGLRPLGGAQVAASGRTATTNDNGFYSFSDLESSPPGVTVSKAGYQSETRPLRFGGFNVNIELVRESDIHVLSGVVFERTATGLVAPVAGAMVTEMSCNAVSQGCLYNLLQRVMTDTNGVYRIPGVYGGKNNFMWVDKEGFEDPFPPHYPEASEGGHALTIDDDTRFDVQLVRR